MIEWSEQHLMIRDVVRKFIEAEIVPNLEELEHGDMPPYDILRKMFSTFGMDEMARARFKHQLERKKAEERGEKIEEKKKGVDEGDDTSRADSAAIWVIMFLRWNTVRSASRASASSAG